MRLWVCWPFVATIVLRCRTVTGALGLWGSGGVALWDSVNGLSLITIVHYY